MKYSLQALQCHVHVHVNGFLNVELLSYNEKYNFISMLNVHVTNGAMSNNRTRSPSCRIHLPTLGSPTVLRKHHRLQQQQQQPRQIVIRYSEWVGHVLSMFLLL
jgi:hypothetical protein